MTNLQAAIGLAQLEQLDEFILKKRQIGALYNEFLKDCPEIELPIEETEYARNIYWVYGVVLKDELPVNASVIMSKLGERKIGTRPFFYPMHKQPIFNQMGLFKKDSHPNSERLAERGFYVPSGLALTQDEIKCVSEALVQILTR